MPLNSLIVFKSEDNTLHLVELESWRNIAKFKETCSVKGGFTAHSSGNQIVSIDNGIPEIRIWKVLSEQTETIPPNVPSGLFLKNLKLKDVRSLESLEISFDMPTDTTRKWTFLLGENACGKTTLLRSIALLTSGQDAFLDLIGKNPGDWIRQGASFCQMEATILPLSGEVITISIQIQRGQSKAEVWQSNLSELNKIDTILKSKEESLFTFGFGCSRRLSRPQASAADERGSFDTDRANCVATLFDSEARLYPLQKLALELDFQSRKDGERILRDNLSGLLQDTQFSHLDRENKRLIFQTGDGEIALEQLSDGYQSMTAWCGDLMFRVIQSLGIESEPLQQSGLILFDEIDLHLHPVWQRQLRRFLSEKLPNFQIIATTHSPLTAQQADEGELYIIQRESPQQSPALFRYEGNPRSLMIQELLTSTAFGVDSIYEERTRSLRKHYLDLKNKEDRSVREEAEFQNLIQQLGELSKRQS